MDLLTPIARCNRLNRFSFIYRSDRFFGNEFLSSFSVIEKFMKLMVQNCKELKNLIFGYCFNRMSSSIGNDLFMLFGMFPNLRILNVFFWRTYDEKSQKFIKSQTIKCLEKCNLLSRIHFDWNQISDGFLEDIDIHLPNLKSVFLKLGENFTFKRFQTLAKLKNIKNLEIDINYDYSIFDIESDVIIKLISDCLSFKNMKFHQKRPIKQLLSVRDFLLDLSHTSFI